jgi:hypothetical protein
MYFKTCFIFVILGIYSFIKLTKKIPIFNAADKYQISSTFIPKHYDFSLIQIYLTSNRKDQTVTTGKSQNT